jgi:hypothetical protein
VSLAHAAPSAQRCIKQPGSPLRLTPSSQSQAPRRLLSSPLLSSPACFRCKSAVPTTLVLSTDLTLALHLPRDQGLNERRDLSAVSCDPPPRHRHAKEVPPRRGPSRPEAARPVAAGAVRRAAAPGRLPPTEAAPAAALRRHARARREEPRAGAAAVGPVAGAASAPRVEGRRRAQDAGRRRG